MSRTDAPKDEHDAPCPAALSRLAEIVASVPFASSVVVIIAVVCVVGTLLPQGADVGEYLQKHPDAKGWMGLLDFLGLTHVFSAWWFMALLGLLATSLAVCAFRKLVAARGKTGRRLWRVLGSMLTHVSLLLVLGGGVIRGIWGESGYLEFREGETRAEFMVGEGARKLPFSVHLAKFEVEHYELSAEQNQAKPRIIAERLHVSWPQRELEWSMPIKLNADQFIVPEGEERGSENSFRVNIRRRILDFVIDAGSGEAGSRSDEPKNPAILVEIADNTATNMQWLFAKHPDFNTHGGEGLSGKAAQLRLRYDVQTDLTQQPRVKDYKSTLRILEGGEVVMEKTIEVNAPLSYRGYALYQSGFDPRDPKWTSLQVVRDPGVPLVYAGFTFMILGLIAVFYLYPGTRRVVPPGNAQEEPPHGNDV